MGNAENALAEFNGPRAAEAANKAAEILEKFLKDSESLSGGALAGLKFCPGLGGRLGNSVEQLLAEMGLGKAQGPGSGGGSGYSARRDSNVGLYGQSPTQGSGNSEGDPNSGGGPADGSHGGGQVSDNRATQVGVKPPATTGGDSAEAIPLRYRQRVGQFFQRMQDEAGEK
jgi:hypothetical protein